MRAFVRFATPVGPCELGTGDLIGRLSNAALRIDDPRVSEAHALVSLRRGALRLLSLRRMVAVNGKPESDVRLVAGQVIELAEGLSIEVLEVVAPQAVLGLRGRGLGQRMLASVVSLSAGPPLLLTDRFVAGATAYVWSSDETCRLRAAPAADRELAPGDRFMVGKHELEVCLIPVAAAGAPSTVIGGGVGDAVRIVANYDTVEIHRSARAPVVVGGIRARLLSELVGYGGPVAWEVCARQLWPEGETLELRHRWDVALSRLRRQLREAGVRGDLITADRAGQVQLLLYESDLVEDRT